MKLVYSGVHTDIEIDLPTGGLLTAERGVPFEVGDELGASLLENSDFAVPAEPKGDKPKNAPAIAAGEE